MTQPEEPQRRLLLELLHSALAAVEGRRCTRAALAAPAAADARPVWVAAIGKAACSMALGARDALGARLERTLIVTKDGHVIPEAAGLPGLQLCESSHPVPDERSLRAGARLLEFLDQMPAGVRPLFLISGGASSLIEVLASGVGLAELQALNARGLASGMSIETLNSARGAISQIKAGRLAARVNGRGALALLISDVPGNDPAVIGSGLMGKTAADDLQRIVVACIEDAMRAVQARAGTLGCSLAGARYEGDAERLAVRFAHELHLSPTPLKVWGGESVVRLPAQPGRGGRNQHLALAAARLMAGYGELHLLAAGTDGTDGPTGDAGAIVDGETCGRAMLAGFDVDRALRGFDSGPLLEATGDLLHTGPTGTNVGDLVIGLKLSEGGARAWLNAA
jgi:glycerate 2-kinase